MREHFWPDLKRVLNVRACRIRWYLFFTYFISLVAVTKSQANALCMKNTSMQAVIFKTKELLPAFAYRKITQFASLK